MENNAMIQFVEVLKNNPNHAYDYIANNYHKMSKMELCDIIKELIYGIDQWVCDMEQMSVWNSVAEELQEQYVSEDVPF